MNFSATSNQTVVGKLLRLPLRLLPPRAVVPILQGSMKGKKWVAGSSTHGCWLGSYEYDKQRLFETTVRAGDVVFDVGANVGFYTLLSSVLVGSRGRVVAFEPVPRNLKFLKKHLRLNRVSNVLVMPTAVSDAVGEVHFDNSSGPSVGHISELGALRVTTVMLDSLVDEGRIPSPHLVKIDVEGAEAAVLRGMKTILLTSKPTLFLATHGDQARSECLALLKAARYNVRPLDHRDEEAASEFIAIHTG